MGSLAVAAVVVSGAGVVTREGRFLPSPSAVDATNPTPEGGGTRGTGTGDLRAEVERLARVLDPRAWLDPADAAERAIFPTRQSVALGQAARAVSAGWTRGPDGVMAALERARSDGERAAESRWAARLSPDGAAVEALAESIWQQAAAEFAAAATPWSRASTDAKTGIRWVARAALTALQGGTQVTAPCEPGCGYEPGHLSSHPCGGPHTPGAPCRFCEAPTPLDGSPCPDCWTRVPDNLADAKALLALGRLSVDLTVGGGNR